MASADDHIREAKNLMYSVPELPQFEDGSSPWATRALLAALVHSTLAVAAEMKREPRPESGSSYGSEFDRLVSSWQALEDEHDPIHPDRDECGGVGGCPMMFAAVQLEARMIDELTEWRRSTAVREGRAACSCDHHGDHAGCDHACDHACECAS